VDETLVLDADQEATIQEGEGFSSEEDLDEFSEEFVEDLIDKILAFTYLLAGHQLHAYQVPFARRIIRSVVINDGSLLTALAARQSGKSEILANVVAALMVLLPRLAKIYPDLLGKFATGFWVGMFAPIEAQAETLFGRTVTRLSSERALEILGDPEIDDVTAKNPGVTRGVQLKRSGSVLMMMTANPRAKIESKSFHLIIIDECQDADDLIVSKSISPMGAYYNATMVKTGTPTTKKNNFYKSIQINKRTAVAKASRRNHFEWNWRDVVKVNPNYKKYIRKEMLQLGEDSDEFQMSYNCVVAETRVLTADLRYVPAGDLVVGDRLVGFDEERPEKGAHRQFRESVVTSTARVIRPSYQVTLDDGTEVTSSSGHLWLVSTAGRRTEWKTTEDLLTTDRIFKLVDVWGHDHDYETGYLAAAFDGEGHFLQRKGQTVIGFSQKDNLMLADVREHLAAKGVPTWDRVKPNGTNGDVHNVFVAGGRAGALRFLGQIRPQRLLDKLNIDLLGSIGRHDHVSQRFEHPLVVSKEFVGEIELVALETTTKTFIAEGLASHNCKWMLDRGMFISQSAFESLGDTSQQIVRGWNQSPVVVGVDPARKVDSTVVTVLWVNWDAPDEFGFFDHRVLNWLEIQGDDWEEQYFQIVNFLAPYDVLAVGVDSTGVGDAVAQRLKLLLPRSEVLSFGSNQAEQAKRWKHLTSLIQRRSIGWPAHAKTRRLKVYQRFMQQMLDAEKKFSGQYFTVEAPNETGAHDDFVDSLAIAAYCTAEMHIPHVDVSVAPWFS
jgi:hypothetical protein